MYRYYLTLLLSLSTLVCVFSQSAQEMLAKYTEATGGQAAWDQVQTIRVTGSVRLSQPEMVLPFERIMSRAGQQLTRLQINGMNYTDSAYDGDRAWGTNRMMQAELKTEEETENLRRSSTEFPYPAHNWEAKGFSATYLDTIRLNGRLTHRIKLKKTPHIQNGKEQDNISTLYIDANSFLLVRTESEILDGPYQGQLLRANLSDYREVEGRWYPFVSEMAYDDQTFQVLTTEEVFFNESISADHFAFPE